jgi:hypothetical protein
LLPAALRLLHPATLGRPHSFFMSSYGSVANNLQARFITICQSPWTLETAAKLTTLFLARCARDAPLRQGRLIWLHTPDVGVCTGQSRHDQGNEATALMNASGHGHLEVVRFLVRGHATVNQSIADGKTTLIAAAYGGHAEIVRFLVAEGSAAIEAQWLGRTALRWAGIHNRLDVVRVLLAAGADVLRPRLRPDRHDGGHPRRRHRGGLRFSERRGAALIGLPVAARPPANAAAAWVGAAVQAHEAWLTRMRWRGHSEGSASCPLPFLSFLCSSSFSSPPALSSPPFLH